MRLFHFSDLGVTRAALLSAAVAATLVIHDFVSRVNAHADDHKSVLILFSNESFLPANIALGNALVHHLRLGSPERLNLFSEFLDLVRFPGDEYKARAAEALRTKYDGMRFDLVVAVGPQSLKLLADDREELFTEVPIVFTGIRSDDQAAYKLHNATGILMRLDPLPTLELALGLQPHTRRVVVVTGASDFDQSWYRLAHQRFSTYPRQLEFRYLSGLPMATLVEELKRLTADSIVIFLTGFTDGNGQYYLPADAARLVADASSVPVYGPYDTYIGTGIVGGCMDTFEQIGGETGRLGLRVLAGEKPETIAPYLLGDSMAVVDWRQLARWGLDEALLPERSELRHRRLSPLVARSQLIWPK